MPTRVESTRASAAKTTDLLKTLPVRSSDETPRPFKKELAKAREANENPKSEVKPEPPQPKKAVSRSAKPSDTKPKQSQQATEAAAPVPEDPETSTMAEQLNPPDDAAAPPVDEVDAERPPVKPAKADAKLEAQDAVDPGMLAVQAQTVVQKQEVPKASAENEQKPEPDASIQICAMASPEAQATPERAADTDAQQPFTEKQAALKPTDQSQAKTATAEADRTWEVVDERNQQSISVVAADAEEPTTKSAARPQAKLPTAPQGKDAAAAPTLAIQPAQGQQGGNSSSQRQSSGSDPTQQLTIAVASVDEAADEPVEAAAQTARSRQPGAKGEQPEFSMMTPKAPGDVNVAKATAPPPPPPEVQFAATNHDSIISGVRSELLPNGGTMHIRLDPPELGALQVRVTMQNGVMTAAFETSNDDATRLLSHSLTQLKHALESQGVSVDKLHVQQSPRNESPSNQKDENGQPQGNAENNHSAQQEQQRKEMIRRMWRRLGVGYDPLDLVA